jgi:hypothetical protein
MTTVAERKMVPWDHCWPSLARLRKGNDSSSTDNWQWSGSWCHGYNIGCYSTSCTMAIMAAVQILVHNNDGGGGTDDGALALLAVPHLLVQCLLWWQHGGWCKTTTAAKQKRVPWRHCCLFLALSSDGKDSSGVNKSAQQWWWRWHRRWCLGIVGCSLLAHATRLIEAAQRMVHGNNSPSRTWCFSTIVGHPLPAHATATTGAARSNGGRADNGAPTLLVVPSLFYSGNDGSSATMVAKQKTVPWQNCWLFLALSCNGNNESNANNGAQQQWWWLYRGQCLSIVGCSLPSRATTAMTEA